LRPELSTETAPDSHLLLQFDNGCSLTTLRLIRHEEARNVWMTGEQCLDRALKRSHSDPVDNANALDVAEKGGVEKLVSLFSSLRGGPPYDIQLATSLGCSCAQLKSH
jgi:hypothetical protein